MEGESDIVSFAWIALAIIVISIVANRLARQESAAQQRCDGGGDRFRRLTRAVPRASIFRWAIGVF